MTQRSHDYALKLVWDGNTGGGTTTYSAYGRQYRVLVSGKPALEGSADPLFRGDAAKHNPEDLLLAAISSCHMLTYLALCARNGVSVTAYEDDARGTLVFDGKGGGKFETVTLRITATIANGERATLAAELHAKAHEECFIAASCNFPIHHEAAVRVA